MFIERRYYVFERQRRQSNAMHVANGGSSGFHKKVTMVEVRRSRRIQSQSDDEASVTPSSSAKEATASTTRPRRATKDSSGRKAASTAKGKKELEAIPETILGGGAGTDDAAVGTTTTAIPKDKSDRKMRNLNSSSATRDGLSSKVDEQVVEVPKKKNEIVDKEVVSKSDKKKVVTTTTTDVTVVKSTEEKKKRKSNRDKSAAVEVASTYTLKSKDKSSTKKKDTPNPTPKAASAVVKPNESTDGPSAEPNNIQPSKNKLKRMRQSLPDAPQAVVPTAKSAEKNNNNTAQEDTTPSKSSKKIKKMNDATPDKESIPEDEPLATNITTPTELSQTSKTKKSSSRKNKKSSHHKREQKSIKYAKPSVSPNPNLRKHAPRDKSLPLSAVVPKESFIKPKNIMDVKVHRLRFLKLHPRSILSMASTTTSIHFPTTTNSSQHETTQRHPARLAISREGGSVELLSPQDRWVTLGHIPGVRGREVDAMVWIYGGNRGNYMDDNNNNNNNGNVNSAQHQFHPIRHTDEQLRLFGCSRDGTIFELDFATKRQTNVIGSGGGGVFCLTTMCYRGRSTKANSLESLGGGYFAAGCEDGTIKIYDAFGSNGGGVVSGLPTLAATLPSAGSAILSMAWLPGPNGNDNGGGMGGSVIFAAVADGTIRRFDCVTSIVTGPISTGSIIAPAKGTVSISYRWKSTLRMTVENRGLRQSTKVWALQALSDGTVISGDSLGHIQFWDGMSGTMTQTFDHNESGADVLCLAVSKDETKIFASGIDSSVRCIQRKSSTSNDEGLSKWISSNSHRKHSHDVKALAICHKETPNSSNPLELLVSGSVDTRICSYVVQDFKSIRPKIWYNWPSLSPISVSRAQRLIAVTRDNRIDVYRLADDGRTVRLPETRDESKCLVKTIAIQSPFNLNCSVISDDGKFLAASDAVSLYVFSLVVEDDGGILDVRPTKISLSGDCKHPATALRFVKGHLICATNNGPISILAISSDKVLLKHVFKEHMMDWTATSHHFPIVSLDVCSDGKWLAARRFSSEKGAVHVFKLSIRDDGSYQHWWTLPQMDAPTTCIKFLGGVGSAESSLAVGCSNNEFYIYNLDRRSLSHWSNDMGVPLLKKLPKELTSRSEPVTRIVSSPSTPQRFILVGVDDSRCGSY